MTDRGSFHSYFLTVCSVFQRYLSHLNSSFKLLLCGRKKKTVKALCDGEFHSQPSTITHYMTSISQPGIKEWKIQAHFTDLITRVILSNITVWEITLIHVSPVNFRTKGWENRLSRRGATPGVTDSPCASIKEALHSFRLPVNVLALHHFNVKPFP